MSKRASRQARRQERQAFNRRMMLAGGLLVLVLVISFIGYSLLRPQSAPVPTSNFPREISASTVLLKRDAGVFILDVREPDEWNAFHIAGSTLIPLGELETRLQEIPRNREIIVVCRSGNRSATGRDILLNAGYVQVTSMTGGLKDWQARGYPTISG